MDNAVLEHAKINTSDWIALAVFMLAVLGFAAWAKLSTKGSEDFLLAGRSMGWFIVMMSTFATLFSTVSATLAICFGTLFLLLFLLITRGPIPLQLHPLLWLANIYLGLCSSGLAFICWFPALKYLQSSELGSFGYLNIAFTILLSAAFLQEKIPLVFWVGLAFVFLGIYLMAHSKARHSTLTVFSK